MADIRTLWSSRHPAARVSRVALLPFAAVFRVGSTLRGWLYDAGVYRRHSLGAPAVSVGNLTTGGTGKTPVASWIATELRRRGATPAVLLRGYGDDEQRVHEILAPGTIVVANRDRVRGAKAAIDRGADVLVLDDAFQHRRAFRDSDIVLVSADAIDESPWPLPAGPWREPVAALRRASVAMITRKAATADGVQRVAGHIARAAPNVPIAAVHITTDEIRRWGTDERLPLRALAGRPVVAVSGIGDPAAFESQLSFAGIAPDVMRFPDHHPYSDADAAAIAARGQAGGLALCTLKDAVKLGPRWPHGGVPLWYVSQRISVERGAELMAQLIESLLGAR